MNDESMELLRAARPSGQDDADPDMAAARAAVNGDAALTAALAAERTADTAFARALHAAEMPESLPDRLIAAMRAAAGAGANAEPPADMELRVLTAVRTAAPSGVKSPTVSRRGWLVGFSAAAAAALAAGGSYWWARLRHPLSIEGLTEELVAIAKGGVRLARRTPDKAAIANWMTEKTAPRADTYPARLDALGRKGCQLYYIAGHPVSLECFVLPGGALIHLFCTGAGELTNPPPAGTPPRVFTTGSHTAAAWTHGQRTIVLLSHESPTIIQPLLA